MSRLIDSQRLARRLGKLRAGYFDTSGPKGRPARSETWIITSTDKNLIEALAEQYGRPVEEYKPQGIGRPGWKIDTGLSAIEAILPEGDPVSVTYETWSKGGVQRRCDGGMDKKSGRSCICRAQYGPEFYKTAPKDAVCKRHTRLSVILPDAPDVGQFLVESHGFYASEYIATEVDFIKNTVGPDMLVPIYVVIDWEEKMQDGKKKIFPVVHLKQRGVSTGQFLAAAGARHRALLSSRQVAAIEAAPAPLGYLERVAAATSRDEILAIRREVAADPHAGITAAEFDAAAKQRLAELQQLAALRQQVATRWTGTEADLAVAFGEFVSETATLDTARPSQLEAFLETLPDVAEADIVEDEPPAAAGSSGPVSRDQQKSMFAAFGKLGLDRDERLRDMSVILDRTVHSSNDLTAEDASKVLDVLNEADGNFDAYAELLNRIAQAHQSA